MTVTYTLEYTGRTEHEVVEVPLARACPTCSADWTGPGNPRPHGSHRSYECVACGTFADGQLVDQHGRAVAPGQDMAGAGLWRRQVPENAKDRPATQ